MSQGWTCPRCDRAYAPTVNQCLWCPPKSTVQWSSSSTYNFPAGPWKTVYTNGKATITWHLSPKPDKT